MLGDLFGLICEIGFDFLEKARTMKDFQDKKIRDVFPNWEGWRYRAMEPKTEGMIDKLRKMAKGK